MDSAELLERTQDRFLKELRHHLGGWLAKFTDDLSEKSFKAEIRALRSDPVYSAFGLATPEYALIRLLGRVSISIGRRLGEIYDKLPRFIAQARFDLKTADVAPKFNGLQLDVCVPCAKITDADEKHVRRVAKRVISGSINSGLAIEIRYNFNPNDSARLRKDVEVARLLRNKQLSGIYLIFSIISPRDEAIRRLKRAGWIFLIGPEANDFFEDLVGIDIRALTASEPVAKEITTEMAQIMTAVFQSHAVREIFNRYDSARA